MTSTPSPAALQRAEAALDEIAPRGGVGEIVDATGDAEGVLSLQYRSLLAGYPDWRWTVTLSTVDEQPSVLEVALLPGESSLTAPEWVPWADRLAEYLAAKEAGTEDDAIGEGADEGDADVEFDDFDEGDLAADDDEDMPFVDDDVASDDDDADGDEPSVDEPSVDEPSVDGPSGDAGPAVASRA